jgi:hypothetical protein
VVAPIAHNAGRQHELIDISDCFGIHVLRAEESTVVSTTEEASPRAERSALESRPNHRVRRTALGCLEPNVPGIDRLVAASLPCLAGSRSGSFCVPLAQLAVMSLSDQHSQPHSSHRRQLGPPSKRQPHRFSGADRRAVNGPRGFVRGPNGPEISRYRSRSDHMAVGRKHTFAGKTELVGGTADSPPEREVAGSNPAGALGHRVWDIGRRERTGAAGRPGRRPGSAARHARWVPAYAGVAHGGEAGSRRPRRASGPSRSRR